jgi:hypothetical protein
MNLFRIIDENQNSLLIERYSISQTTLQDVFNGFTSFQQNDEIIVQNVTKKN